MANPAEVLDQALRHHQAGRLAEAEPLYRQVLRDEPGNANAWHFLGLLAFQVGQAEAAVEFINRAIALGGDVAPVHLNLGRIHEARGRLDEARDRFERARRLQPDSVEACLHLGDACRKLGRMGEAEACFREAVRLKPDDASAHNNLGMVLESQGRLDEAQACLEEALRLQPGWAMAQNNLGVILRRQGRPAEALDRFQQAVRLRPDDADALFNLGQCLRGLARSAEAEATFHQLLRLRPDHAPARKCLAAAYQEQGRPAEAQAAYREAIRRQPDDAEAQASLGDLLRDEDRLDEARACYERALALAPSDGLRIKLALLLPTLVPSREEIPKWRERLRENLDRLFEQDLILTEPHREVGAMLFFPLAYHGLDDRDLVSRLAALYLRCCPSLAYVAPHCLEPTGPTPTDRPIRVGFVSSFFQAHSIGRYYGRIIERLSRPDFRVTLFPGGRTADALPESLRARADAVIPLDPQATLADLRDRVASERLDVLCYPEVGMHPLAYFLAFARLAPLQCVAGGHPVTTGIPALDYFLSSRDLEPDDARDHYSERLVTFDDPFHSFEPPKLSGPPRSRRDFGLPDEAHLYLCVQHLFKIHPDFDELAASILREDPKGRLVLVEGHRSRWSQLLRARLSGRLGEDMARVEFVPWQPYEDYLHLLTLADALLDTPHFNGGVTTLQALGLGLPVVTRPGAFLRGRQAYGCYRRMGVLDCVADDDRAYARIALRLANDPAWREEVRARIRARNAVLFENEAVVRELEDFFRRAVAEAREAVS